MRLIRLLKKDLAMEASIWVDRQLISIDFGTLPDDALSEAEGLRAGEVVYVALRQEEEGEHEFVDVSLEPPSDGIFLRGRLLGSSPPLRVRYGIEAFFAPKERALNLKSDLRDGGTAVLMVTGSGQAALKDVIPSPAAE